MLNWTSILKHANQLLLLNKHDWLVIIKGRVGGEWGGQHDAQNIHIKETSNFH